VCHKETRGVTRIVKVSWESVKGGGYATGKRNETQQAERRMGWPQHAKVATSKGEL